MIATMVIDKDDNDDGGEHVRLAKEYIKARQRPASDSSIIVESIGTTDNTSS